MDALRLYGSDELGKDGYPPEWHVIMQPDRENPIMGGFPGPGIKHLVRELAEHRCVRCLHPYHTDTAGARGEWSQCDDQCVHGAPMRIWCRLDAGEEGWAPFDPTPEACGPAVAAVAPAPAEAQWRILTVHHLDMNKANCRWWNLAALCQRCHLQIQGKVQMARVWPWEHSSWFRVYVAGYYAYAYLGEELSRVETLERMDELLELERVA